MSRLCYPYGSGISCTCDARKRILTCLPVVNTPQAGQVATLQENLFDEHDDFLLDVSNIDEPKTDETTEIILAATFLLIVILSFVA